jgi:hypothetical protein
MNRLIQSAGEVPRRLRVLAERGGTTNCAAAMRPLPYGFQSYSSQLSLRGTHAWYVDISDIVDDAFAAGRERAERYAEGWSSNNAAGGDLRAWRWAFSLTGRQVRKIVDPDNVRHDERPCPAAPASS